MIFWYQNRVNETVFPFSVKRPTKSLVTVIFSSKLHFIRCRFEIQEDLLLQHWFFCNRTDLLLLSMIPSEGEKVNGSSRLDLVNMHVLHVYAWAWTYDSSFDGETGPHFAEITRSMSDHDNDSTLTLGFLHS